MFRTILTLCLVLTACTALAEEPHPFNIRDLVDMDRLVGPEVSPDGSFAIAAVTTFDVEENEGKGRLYRIDGAGEAD